MSGKRPGQTRFEAWVPDDLYKQFASTVPNRKAWLVGQMSAALGPDPEPVKVEPPHTHRRERTGDRWVSGVNVGAYRCLDCGQEW
jgi:hypothetical protein